MNECLQASLMKLEEQARAAYSAPGRVYHGVDHLDDCLRKLDAVETISARERRTLRLALIWHDLVYDPTRSDNEDCSARKADRALAAAGLPSKERAEVVRLILLTRGHRAELADKIGALMVSIDLSILGESPEAYRRYAAAIRTEYAHVPDDAYRQGRVKVLRQMLEADPLFPDPDFRSRYEDQARRNLAEEIERLSPA